MAKTEEFNKWKDYYLNGKKEDLKLWPQETLIRMMKGPYLDKYNMSYKNKKLIEVGCGTGVNFQFYTSLGLNVSGTEVDQTVCDKVSNMALENGIEANLKEGTNICLPFDDNSFEYLVSWNVLHYQDNEIDMLKALKEYSRVLKPGGRIFLSTTGPEHKILINSEKIAPNRYQIGRSDDMRKGQVFFYFDNKDEIKRIFSESFDDILIGRTHSDIFTDILDWYIVTCVKK